MPALTPPGTKHTPSRINPSFSIFYGHQKAGKTSVMARLPGSYLCELRATEGCGADFVEYEGHTFESLKELDDAIPQLRKWGMEEKRFDKIVIDTIDALEDWIVEDETKWYQKSINMKDEAIHNSVYERGYGKGVDQVRNPLKNIVAKLLTCAPHIIFVAHLKAGSYGKTEQVVTSKDIDLPPKLAALACYGADAIAYLFRNKESELWATFATNEEVNCGSRLPRLSGKRFKLSGWEGAGPERKLVVNWNEIFLPAPAMEVKQETK